MRLLLNSLLLSSFLVVVILAQEKHESQIEMKGFYLGMTQEEVKEIYGQLQTDRTAEFISIEREKYRDMIKLDNEFSSMGNKIEIEYDDEGLAKKITFQYKTTDILFGASQLDAAELVKKIEQDYQLPEMEFENMGMVKSWSCIDEKTNTKISVDDNKNIRLQRVNK